MSLPPTSGQPGAPGTSDPLLRAVAGGDPACPDGAALVRLGSLVRRAATPPLKADLRARVLAATRLDVAGPDSLIDEVYDGGSAAAAAADPGLQALANVVRRAATPGDPINLLEGLEGRLRKPAGSGRLQQAHEARARWRMLSLVVGAHVAALLAVAVIIGLQIGEATSASSHEAALTTRPGLTPAEQIRQLRLAIASEAPQSGLDHHLPRSWSEVRGQGPGQGLLLLRQRSAWREAARAAYGMTSSRDTVLGGLRWIIGHQHSDGALVTADAADTPLGLAAHGAATLALLSEGLDDEERARAADSALGWLCVRMDQTQASSGDAVAVALGTLALVEGAAQTGRADVRQAAERALRTHGQLLADKAGGAGLGGLGLVAFETAYLAGFDVSSTLRQQARAVLGRSLPSSHDADLGRLGLAVLARQINAQAQSPVVVDGLRRLLAQSPRLDEQRRADPLGWLFATWAMREGEADAWMNWSLDLQRSLIACFRFETDGTAWLGAGRVHYAPGTTPTADLLVTAVALLNLQAPYRTVPLGSGPADERLPSSR